MKKLASAALLASVGLLLLAGCSKSGDPADDGGKIIITCWPQPLVKDVEGKEAPEPVPDTRSVWIQQVMWQPRQAS